MRSRPLLTMFLALWLAYGVAGVWTTGRISATGDEPFYFLAADSLVHGEGFDLTDRVAVISSSSYAPDPPLRPEAFVAQTAPSLRSGGRYPLHDLGLSFVIAAPLAIGGRGLVVLLLAGAMAAAVVLGVRAARTLGIGHRAAIAGGALTAVAAPAVTYSGQVFPDSLAALPIAVALCALVGALPRVWLGIAVAALPLLHLRFWPVAVGLLLAGLLLGPLHRRNIVRHLLPLAAAIVTIAAIDGWVYGLPVPHAGFLLFFHEGAAGPVAAYAAHDAMGPLGPLFDRSRGLIPAAPIALVMFVGVGALLEARTGRILLMAIAPYLLLVSFLDWTGGSSPHARYFAPLVALFVVLIGRGIGRVPRAAVLLGAWTAIQSCIYVVAPELRYDRLGQPPLGDQAWTGAVGFAPSALFPVVAGDVTLQLVVVIALVGAALLIGTWSARPGRMVVVGRRIA
ncbi:MAG: hypothetical protein NVS9B6_19390 [Candidatus Limnocylindrales bacterium]